MITHRAMIIIDVFTAKAIYSSSSDMEVYKIYDDNTEALIEHIGEISHEFNDDYRYGIEGEVHYLKSEDS